MLERVRRRLRHRDLHIVEHLFFLSEKERIILYNNYYPFSMHLTVEMLEGDRER